MRSSTWGVTCPFSAPVTESEQADALWWRSAVIYQVYVRSFADGDGDGTGDLAGVRARLRLSQRPGRRRDLVQPLVSVTARRRRLRRQRLPRDIHPAFGTLEEAELLISEALALGIRTIIDIVPNHVSDQHPWFRAALASTPGSPERARFWFRPGRGVDGDEPPNQWQSIFGGNAWTRVADGEWYLHLFAPEQPDLNWTHPDVWEEHENVLRFWFDRGAAGVRIDSAALLMKDPELRDERSDAGPGEHPFTDRDETHDVYRRWRGVADSYEEPRVLVGEIWLPDADRLARYLRPDELHTAFNFDFLGCPWEADRIRASIDASIAVHEPVGAPPTWVLSNHDVTRPVTRYGRADSSFAFATKRPGVPTDLERGTRRARAAALLTMALPGSMYVYQGEELGLPEVEDIPPERRRDPMWLRSEGNDPGRDGCRVPIPWAGLQPPHGFSPDGAEPPWLDQPDDWAPSDGRGRRQTTPTRCSRSTATACVSAGVAPGAQAPSAGSRVAGSRSRSRAATRSSVSSTSAPSRSHVPDGAPVLIASNELEGGALPQDTTVWLYQENGGAGTSN